MMAKRFLLAALMMTPAAATEDGPITKVVALLNKMLTSVTQEGAEEQKAYDEYACWVEDVVKTKAKDISDAETLITTLSDEIVKLSSSTATFTVELKNIKKDIADNIQATADATAIRDKEKAAYLAEKADSDTAVASLNSATAILSGAGKKEEFLTTKSTGMRNAEFLSISSGVERVIKSAQAQAMLTQDQLEAVAKFVANPQSIAAHGFSATQTGQNPAGDYAPASDQIQGILKSMHDSFTADLASDKTEEEAAAKSFSSLTGSKSLELGTLEGERDGKAEQLADDTKSLADKKVLRESTKEEMAADKKTFENAKEAANEKSGAWSTRCRLRTEELAALSGAIDVLSDNSDVFAEASNPKVSRSDLGLGGAGGADTTPEIQSTGGAGGFTGGAGTYPTGGENLLQDPTLFLQLKAVTNHVQKKQEAMSYLQTLAAKHQSGNMQRIMETFKATGHFDSVMTQIDSQMKILRTEDATDIAHKDRCELKENAAGLSIEDLNAAMTAVNAKIERLGNGKTDLDNDLLDVERKITETNSSIGEMARLRTSDAAAFVAAKAADENAVKGLVAASAVLTKLYSSHKVDVGLIQVQTAGGRAAGNGTCTEKDTADATACGAVTDLADTTKCSEVQSTTGDALCTYAAAAVADTAAAVAAPEYAEAAPKAEFNNVDKHKGEATNVVAIIAMMKEDFEKEIAEGTSDEAKSIAEFKKSTASMKQSLAKQKATKVNLEKEIAEAVDNLASANKVKTAEQEDLSAQNKVKEAVEGDCDWIATDFADRKTKRKTEMDALVDAKDFLSGVDPDEDSTGTSR